jgi:glycosyltransferase involved in cell wall biosynthesis
MRVGIFHNRYIHRGGEDVVVDQEIELLSKAGHEVHVHQVDNREEIARSPLGPLRTAFRARWNPKTVRDVGVFLDAHPIDVAHIHNYFPVLSPSLHATLHGNGVPVVQSLHNFRLLCANGYFLRDERSCEDCVSRGPWNAVKHGCYRGSRVQTAVWAELTAHHRRRGTWESCVDLFLAPSEFARGKLLQTGIPAEQLRVVPNPVLDPGPSNTRGEGAVFVGRLSREKGVHLLIEAWRELDGVPLRIVGAGPESEKLRVQASGMPHVEFLGERPRDGVFAALCAAGFFVAPSDWYEVFGLTVLEAMACGRAAVVPRTTALAELIEPERTGLCFERGDVAALARACRTLAGDPERTHEMGLRARERYEEAFAPDACLAHLESAFESVMRESSSRT